MRGSAWMCLRGHSIWSSVKRQVLESPSALAIVPGSNYSPCGWGPCSPKCVLLQTGSTPGFLFCCSLIIPQQCPAQIFFISQLARKFIPDDLEIPFNLVVYNSMIPDGIWIILPPLSLHAFQEHNICLIQSMTKHSSQSATPWHPVTICSNS